MTGQDQPGRTGPAVSSPMRVAHVGLRARKPAELAAFYQDVMGMAIIGGSPSQPAGGSVFLSGRPDDENHEIVFFADPSYAHVAFRVATLADLRACHQAIKARGLPIHRAVNHGVSFAFYFHDPEGNQIEIYWPTGMHNWQPYGHPVDFEASEADLIADLEQLAARNGLSVPPAVAAMRTQASPVASNRGV